MSGLKQLRNRVRSIKSTQKITKAMQVVSAAKLKKIKELAESLNEYSAVLGNIMHDIATGENLMKLAPEDRRFFSKDLSEKPYLLVVLTSERGLCGGFNSSIVKRVKADIQAFKKEGKKVRLLVIGKKGRDALRSQYGDLIEAYFENNQDNPEAIAREVKNKIIRMIELEEAGSCYMYYNHFKNAMTQILTREQILPAESSDDNEEKSLISEYEYEGQNLVHRVIDLYISGQVNYGLLQSKASEQGARMTAMDNATRNAGELIEKLTLKLNRSRQAIITTELTEIISGAEAL